MASKVVLITGANSGIGYEAVKSLMQSKISYHILVGSRDPAKGKQAVESLRKECGETKSILEAMQLDLTSDESIDAAFQKIKGGPGHLDVLVNNAGSTFDIEYIRNKVSLRECFTKSYDVNVAGTNVLTHTLMPLLFKSTDPRLLFVSGLSQITVAAKEYFPTPPQPAGWPKPKADFDTIGYRCSKVALNMLMLDWNHKLAADEVKVWAVAPGFLATNLGGIPEMAAVMGAGHPSAGGEMIRTVVEGERDADVGKFVSKSGFAPW